jgi:hypothetical protein
MIASPEKEGWSTNPKTVPSHLQLWATHEEFL